MERGYLDEVLARLDPKKRHILDLGCGAGEPIARYLIDAGCRVTGVDASAPMIALAAERFPQMAWIVADMRALALQARFGAIIAWDSFFHLRAADPRRRTMFHQKGFVDTFAITSRRAAFLLFTSGPAHGEAIERKMYGQRLYHASLDAEEYRELIAAHGFELLRHMVEDPQCGWHTVWLAQAP